LLGRVEFKVYSLTDATCGSQSKCDDCEGLHFLSASRADLALATFELLAFLRPATKPPAKPTRIDRIMVIMGVIRF
jgi:hypothetical protein